MAVRNETPGASNGRAWLIALALVALFAIALFLRAYWNLDAATEGGTYVLSGGPDPWYHKHAVDAIQARGFETLVDDPLLNYPQGAVNPHPPLFQWTIAVAGWILQPLFGGDLEAATWATTLWTAPVFGALSVFPVYFIGRVLFDDRRVGLVAALLWTLSTSAIDAAGIGAADHDATMMFFAMLAFLFYIQSVRHFRGDGNWVTSWRDGGAIARGLGAIFRDRNLGFAYALLSGVAISAVALTWKGFPYVIGVIVAYAGLQMIVDHWKNRDSMGLFLATLVALLVGTLLAYPYYALTDTTNFVRPVWFIIVAFVLGGLALVPTRDLPTILVMPLALVVAVLVGLVAFFAFPDVWNSLLYTTVYFKRTALYETIGEARAASFSDLAFGIGPAVFLIGLFAWFAVAWQVARSRTSRPLFFALIWGAIALYMANTAVRFMFNAMPIFAVFAAFGTVWVLDWLDFGAIRRSVQAHSGWTGVRRGVRPMHIIGAILLVLLLVVPNTMLAADAAMPRSEEARIAEGSQSDFVKSFMEKRMGAYGQGFVEDYWHEGMEWLDAYDADTPDPADRGAFLAWWDYGHYAIAIGNHPTVADPFQNAYQYAANFLLSQNETHAVQLLGSRIGSLLPQARAEAMLTEVGIADAPGAYKKLMAWEYVDEMDTSEAAAFLAKAEAETGKKIRYVAVDARMMPLDDPQTPSLDYGSSIYFAPVKLKGDDPDDYVPVTIEVGGEYITQSEFQDRIRANPTATISATAERMEFTEKFYNSMFYRAYVGTPAEGPYPTLGDSVIGALNNQRPGAGLEHFRVIYATPALKILEYTPGAVVRGTVTEAGSPVAGATVAVYDDAGAMLVENLFTEAAGVRPTTDYNVLHAISQTGPDGAYEIVAPFSMEGGNVTILAARDGVELARTTLVIPRADAATGKEFTADLTVLRGSVQGLVFEDKDGDGAYNATTDVLVPGANVTIGGKTATSGGDGAYNVTEVSAGTQNVTIASDTFDVAASTSRVRVLPGSGTTHDIALDAKPGDVTGLVYADLNDNGAFDAGEAAGFTTLDFQPDENITPNTAEAFREATDSGGNFTATVKAGAYAVTVSFVTPDGTTYATTERVVVASGATQNVSWRLTRT